MKKLILGLTLALIGSLSVAHAATKTHSYPKGKTYSGSTDYIFVSATNGSGFCTYKHGSRSRFIDGEMFCGEDESSYLEYDWNGKEFVRKSSGSSRKCYPLFREIKCSY